MQSKHPVHCFLTLATQESTILSYLWVMRVVEIEFLGKGCVPGNFLSWEVKRPQLAEVRVLGRLLMGPAMVAAVKDRVTEVRLCSYLASLAIENGWGLAPLGML